MKIELREADHQYFVDGVPKRSASEILRPLLEDLSAVPAHHLENAKARGAQVDDACSLILEGKFNAAVIDRLNPETLPYVEAYLSLWRNGSAPMIRPPLSVQTPLYCAELDYCCTPDWHDAESVNDIKATSKQSRTWGLQTAAQWLAHGRAETRRIIWLRPKLKTRQYELAIGGEARFIGSDPRIFSRYDFDVVRAACQGDYDAKCVQLWRMGG